MTNVAAPALALEQIADRGREGSEDNSSNGHVTNTPLTDHFSIVIRDNGRPA
jgi:hypothetical protein